MKLFLLFAFSLFILPLYSQDIKEGEWEYTIKMKMEGLDFEIPHVTLKQCIKKENPFPIEPEEKEKNCKVLKQEVKGSKVNWEIECKDKDEVVNIKGEITYKENSFEGKAILKSKEGEFTQIYSGKYLGPCK